MGSSKLRDGNCHTLAAIQLRWFAVLACAVLLAPLAHPTFAAEADHCAAVETIAVEATPDETEAVCDIAANTLKFMQAHGMQPPTQVTTVHVVGRLTRAKFASGIGTFDAATNSIEVLTYEAAKRLMPEQPAFGVPMNIDLYRSFIAHEIAHAIAHPNFVRRPYVVAHEYIAYTVQLATMPIELRSAILGNIATEGFRHPREIDDTLLGIDPNRFAVKSYLHFIRVGEEANPFEQMLTGRFK